MADDQMMTDALPTGGGGFDWADDVAAEHAASGHDAAVLEAEKEKARKRAERFGQEYKEPKANAIARGLMSRKEVLAMRKEAALKKMNRRGEFVAGIDVFDPAEQAKRAARAAKFGTAAPSALTPEQQAIKDKRDAQDAQRLAANAAALQEAYADAMDDGTTRGAVDGAIIGSHGSAEVVQDFFERRVDPELDASWRADAVHLYGVDHMTTAECVGYFSEYGPVFCEWINDSSCNVVFNDETTARRAIRMKGVAMGAEANPDGGLALPAGTCAEMLWHAGPEFHKDNRTIQLSFRLATEEDIKPDGKIKSRYLWLAGKGGGRGKRRRGGGGGDRHHPYESGGKRRGRGGRGRDRGGMRGYDDDDGGVADLRERIRRKKAEKEDAAMGGDDADVAGTSTAADASVDAAREGGGDAGAGAGVHLQGAVGMMKGALMGAVAGRAAEPPRPEIVSSAGDGVAAAGEVDGDDLRAKLAANAGEDVAMQ